ncbi:hypothetical protein Tco_0874995 [Tanacetum coccineum]|uniref:Uncharacterized protein n=1 Tax=Tanacetum coccineum TaxID=301880 RepID=A0ABQ5BT33_9ASTR
MNFSCIASISTSALMLAYKSLVQQMLGNSFEETPHCVRVGRRSALNRLPEAIIGGASEDNCCEGEPLAFSGAVGKKEQWFWVFFIVKVWLRPDCKSSKFESCMFGQNHLLRFGSILGAVHSHKVTLISALALGLPKVKVGHFGLSMNACVQEIDYVYISSGFSFRHREQWSFRKDEA